MQPFPVETWIQISESKELRKRDKAALARTSTLLGRIAQASLYHSVELEVILRKSAFNKFASSIVSRPELGTLVRSLSLDCTQIYKRPMICLDTHEALRNIFASINNLTDLLLTKFHIDTEFYSTIVSHCPRLRVVDFKGCEVDENVMSQALTVSSVTDVTISDPLSSEGWSAIAHSALRSLKISHWGKYDNFTGRTLSSIFEAAKEFPSLTKLTLQGSFTVDVIPLLESTGQLRHLSLPTSMTDLDLPSSALPRLEYFDGSVHCAEAFIHGRPVHTASLFLDSDGTSQVDLLLALQSSTVPVTELELYGVFTQNLEFLLRRIPESVHTLRLYTSDKTTSALAWLPQLSSLPALRIFKASTHLTWNEDKMRGILRGITWERGFGLQEIIVDGGRWLLKKNGTWERMY